MQRITSWLKMQHVINWVVLVQFALLVVAFFLLQRKVDAIDAGLHTKCTIIRGGKGHGGGGDGGDALVCGNGSFAQGGGGGGGNLNDDGRL